MENIILIRYGEIYLKGQNRPFFENMLVKNIRRAIKPYGPSDVFKQQGRIYIEGIKPNYLLMERLSKVFGIVGINPAYKTLKDLDEIKKMVKTMVEEYLISNSKDNFTFKIESRRSDKTFDLNSMELNRLLGAYVLDEFIQAKVDVHKPDLLINIEIREHAYGYHENIKGAGGMPVATSGRATLLLSGGIDSPVAGWMIAKRGVSISAVHFHSFPYTSEKSKEKVMDLAKKLAPYNNRIKLHVVPFTEIQQELYEKCPEGLLTILMRRYMMKITEKIAEKDNSLALITGESIGQVASQTLESLIVTDDAVSMPVFRPLIGLDKNEIVEIAHKIDTYETSILPYEDCCTIFVPKNPVTKPRLNRVVEAEKILDEDGLILRAIEATEVYYID